MKKIIVAIVLALFYAANIFYERTHSPELSMAAIPQLTLSAQTQTLNTGAQSSGSGDPPQLPQVLGTVALAKSAPATQQSNSSNSQVQTANSKIVMAQAQPLNQSAPAAAAAVKATTNTRTAPSTPPAAQSVPPPAPGHITPPPAASTPPPASNNTPPPASTPPPAQTGQYKNGTYTGTNVDALYGFVQVQVTISNGQISNVQFLSYPNDNPTSLQKSNKATPILAQEAIAAQSANVQAVSGATETSQAFVSSLSSALSQAKV